jgi:hypothetical protein
VKHRDGESGRPGFLLVAAYLGMAPLTGMDALAKASP